MEARCFEEWPRQVVADTLLNFSNMKIISWLPEGQLVSQEVFVLVKLVINISFQSCKYIDVSKEH